MLMSYFIVISLIGGSQNLIVIMKLNCYEILCEL